MLSGIDHVVVLVRDLSEAIAGYEALGFNVTPGGEHGGGATHNALIGFEDGCYFELIAFKDPSLKQDHRWWPRLAARQATAARCSFRRLWVRQMSAHSPRALSTPRSRSWRKPRACLI